ncbi:MAG TPA: PilX N-terminal domain-containing pilus assembly protein [Terriglobales bacterium]|nr:PilX N-terminal domain-containing pilus assembly protein [Terriglobales bacterium]
MVQKAIASTRKQAGFALVAAILLMIIVSAVAVAVVYSVGTEKSVSANDEERNLAFYGAEAAMEKMTADLGGLYQTQKSPTIAQIQALQTAANQPNLSNISYPSGTYQYVMAADALNPAMPASTTQNISSGSNTGLYAQLVSIQLQAVAQRPSGAQVRMLRNVEVALIPVFQFGIFSDSDLSFFPGPAFDFNGRVFTNGNLFLASSGGLTFHAKVQAVKDVVRAVLVNGLDATSRNAAVSVPTQAAGCDGSKPHCRGLGENEGSVVAGPGSAATTSPNSWTKISGTFYNLMLQNGVTGAKTLKLPFVSAGVPDTFEIVRRPPGGETSSSPAYDSRLYNEAQVRILLDDVQANLPGGAQAGDVNLAAGTNYTVDGVGANQYFARGILYNTTTCLKPAGPPAYVAPAWVNPNGAAAYCAANDWPLVTGWLRVEYHDALGNWNNVTGEWLNEGFARQGSAVPNAEAGVANTVHVHAILHFQMIPTVAYLNGETNNHYKYFPINLYDPREGEIRDANPLANGNTSCAIGGIMNVVELNMDNLRIWLAGGAGMAGKNGANVESTTQNGYVVYFSDRRSAVGTDGTQSTLNGEYNYQDVVNPNDAAGAPNGVLDAGEDIRGDGVFYNVGANGEGTGFGVAGAAANNPTTRIASCDTTGQANRVTGARHALKLVNGSSSHLPSTGSGGGVTVASENPVYVQGNWNSNTASGFGAVHVASGVIADAVTLLSLNYTDLRSLQQPTQLGNRGAARTYFRLAIAAGKNVPFPHPAWAPACCGSNFDDFGTDGGVHNFLRYVENWGGIDSNYMGSLISFYYSRQGVGTFKCCLRVYGAPNRNYSFDTEFLDPAKLPPGTPRFEDIDNLGYAQDFRPQ